MKRGILGLLLGTLPSLGSCCYMADWLGCYPDSPLTELSWRTPEATLETFQMAALHADVDRLYLCLSQGFKKRTGLDSMAAHVAWGRLVEEHPFLRSLFRARVEERCQLPDGREELKLAAAGRRFRIVLAPEPCAEVLGLVRDETGRLAERVLLDVDLAGGVSKTLRRIPGGGVACLLDQPAWRGDLEEIDLAAVARLAVGIEWKIDEVGGLDE